MFEPEHPEYNIRKRDAEKECIYNKVEGKQNKNESEHFYYFGPDFVVVVQLSFDPESFAYWAADVIKTVL